MALWIQTGPAQARWSLVPSIFLRGLWFDLAHVPRVSPGLDAQSVVSALNAAFADHAAAGRGAIGDNNDSSFPRMPMTPTPAPTPGHVPLAAVIRGDAVESVHCGSVAVVNASGRLLYVAGNPHTLTFTRSTLKPLQALPFVRDGGPARYGFSLAQVALLCASHSGEPQQVAAVSDMLARAGNAVEDLRCGAHAPGYFDVRGEVPPPPPYSPLAHNCSGKHAGMLASCAMHGWRKSDYLAAVHPLQQEIRAAVAAFAGVAATSLVEGVDGCSAPNYALPLAHLALAFARLAVAADDDAGYGAAPRTLRDAMITHPEMVSGEGRSDLVLARAGRGDWVPKIGAEGVQAIGVASTGLGIAIKVADGSKRGLYPATVAVLDQLGLVDAPGREGLAALAAPVLRNYRGVEVGRVEPRVVLDRVAG